MSVDYEDVKELLSSKLEPHTGSGDSPMAPMTLLYSVIVAESRAEKAERACHVAEAALVRATEKLLECHCHQEPYTSLPVPISHLSRRTSSVVLRPDHKEKRSRSGERQADDGDQH